MAACGGTDDEPVAADRPEAPVQPGRDTNESSLPAAGDDRYPVFYSSCTSNTERVAELIRATLDCEIPAIEPETPYADDYNSMLARAQEESTTIRQGNYPSVKTSVGDFDAYDIVFIGYPIRYGSMATPMQTFLHTRVPKLAGKRIARFATSRSSGISTAIGEARSLCSDMTVIDPTLLLTSSTRALMTTRIPTRSEEIGASREEPEATPGKRASSSASLRSPP